MHTLLSVVVALAGAGLAGWGFLRALRHRHRVAGGGSPRARRAGLIGYAVGGLLALLPDVVAGVVVVASAATNDAAAVLGTLALFVYRCAVILGWGIGAVVLAVTGRRVVTAVSRGLSGAREALDRMPRPGDRRQARWRREAGLEDFPREWAALIDHDRALARRLLDQGNHLESGLDVAVLRDYSDPVTVAAMEALVECDRVRTPGPPPGTRDVLATAYGQAVVRFEGAVEAAEKNARRVGSG